MPTTQTFERQPANMETWEKLKSHIMRQREKRKQEQEQDAEQERHRREQELKRKRDATTLEDIKDQLGKLETNLSDLKKQKHELFLQLKKVLNEDEMRKKQSESEMLAARHAMLAQSQNNQQYSFIINANTGAAVVNNSRLLTSNPSAQQLNQSIHQQQQLLNKASPITTVTSLSSQPNYINSVITQQSLPPAHQSINQQQQPQQLTNKQRTNTLKRSIDRSSPQPTVPYNGVLPNYHNKTALNSYTPNVSKIATTSHQPFFPQSRHLSIPVSQPFDTKNVNAYHFLASGLPSQESAASLAAQQNLAQAAEHASVINSNQLNAQQLAQLQQQKEMLYQHQLMKNIVGLQSPLMSIPQNALQGGITAGYPIQQRPSNQPPPNNQSNSRFPTNRYMGY